MAGITYTVAKLIPKGYIFSQACQIKHLQNWQFELKVHCRKLRLDCPVASILIIMKKKQIKNFYKTFNTPRLKTVSSYTILIYSYTFVSRIAPVLHDDGQVTETCSHQDKKKIIYFHIH